jgi:hypothetical protein
MDIFWKNRLTVCPFHSGIFNPYKGAYQVTFYPSAAQTYTAILTLRHPNVPQSVRVLIFQIFAVPDPALAAAAADADAAANRSATSTSSTVTGPILNPLSNPKIVFAVDFPKMTAAGYGGPTRAVSDFRAMVSQAAGLDGPAWVNAAVVTQAPLGLNATVSIEIV